MLPTQSNIVHRRDFLRGATSLAIAVTLPSAAAAAGRSFPYSAGSERPRTAAFPGSVDCHMHFFDKRVATVPGAPCRIPMRSRPTIARSRSGSERRDVSW